jgi:hypothetical protein
MTFQKSCGRTGIVIPVKKKATETEKTGIRRIPAGICNQADWVLERLNNAGGKQRVVQ